MVEAYLQRTHVVFIWAISYLCTWSPSHGDPYPHFSEPLADAANAAVFMCILRRGKLANSQYPLQVYAALKSGQAREEEQTCSRIDTSFYALSKTAGHDTDNRGLLLLLDAKSNIVFRGGNDRVTSNSCLEIRPYNSRDKHRTSQ